MGASPKGGDVDVYRQADLIRERLGSALKLVEQMAGVPKPDPQSQPVTERTIQKLLKLRRSRDDFFESGLFADPAWDILLELYAAELAQQRISVSSLCVGAAVPATTALRWIAHLEKKGWVTRRQDPTDGRRIFVSLTPDSRRRMEEYFRTVPGGAPLI